MTQGTDLTRKCVTELVSRMMRMPAQSSDDPSVTAKDIRSDLGRAIERNAHSDDHAQRAIQTLVEQNIFRPQESEIVAACDNTPWTQKPKPPCEVCGGARFVTVWMLITYRGDNSWVVEKAERLPDYSNERATAFARKLAATAVRQTVLTAAEPCGCAMRNHNEAN